MPAHAKGLTVDAMDAGVTQGATGGFQSAVPHAPAYLTYVSQALYHSRHPESASLPGTIARLQDANRFNEILESLLGMRLGYILDEAGDIQPTLNGRRFNAGELSSGQKTLIAWAIVLHRQAAFLANAVILLDEPEQNLHADACVRALDALRRLIERTNSQIIVATHSVAILAYVGLRNIYFVDNGAVAYGGNQVRAGLARLLGGEEGRDRLATFLSDADALAFAQFAADCLCGPEVVGRTSGSDPQEEQLLAAVSGTADGPVRVLDFGAGRGRLAAALASSRMATQSVKRDLQYIALCPSDVPVDEREQCAAAVRELGRAPETTASVVDSLDGFAGGAFDWVVLSNVLHEIPPGQWLSTLRQVAGVLAPTGRLLLLEDQEPPIGELPHELGFILLNESEVALLCPHDGSVRLIDSRRQGRLTAIEVNRDGLEAITPASIVRALQAVRDRALAGVLALRNEGPSGHRAGRRHALLTMLYTNASLALESRR